MTENRMTAIVVVKENAIFSFKKYHNISKQTNHFERFKKFVVSTYPEAVYINLYDKQTKEFIRREVIKKMECQR